jgi:cobalamin biosynthetic protein CobC
VNRIVEVPAVSDHGGALARAKARWGDGDDWIDLSTGINPWPYPVPDLPAAAWSRLPEEEALSALKDAARRFYGAPAEAAIAAAPGSQALIQLLPLLLPPTEIEILGPTYAEHARCWRLAGHSVTEITGDELRRYHRRARPILVVVQPNNPDGSVLARPELVLAAHARAAQGGLVVVDEAFAECAPDLSLAFRAGMPGLLLLRSFGKFFGLAGLRLGFALGEQALVARIEAALGPWAVSGPALAIGRAALDDGNWAVATRQRLAAGSEALNTLLSRRGFTMIGGTPLFTLVQAEAAPASFERLAEAHILVRRFDAWPDLLRFGLPPDDTVLDRLDRALR